MPKPWVFPQNSTDYKIYHSPRLNAMTMIAWQTIANAKPFSVILSQLLIGCQDAEAPFSALSLVIKMLGSL